jgi:cell division protein FtsL
MAKKKKDKGNTKNLGIRLVILALFIGELFLYTWCRVQCTRTGYEISRENKNYRQMLLMKKNLKIELARLKSPERIAKIAESKLGLVMPSAKQTIIIP